MHHQQFLSFVLNTSGAHISTGQKNLKRDAEPTRFISEEKIVLGENIPFSQEVLIGEQSDIF